MAGKHVGAWQNTDAQAREPTAFAWNERTTKAYAEGRYNLAANGHPLNSEAWQAYVDGAALSADDTQAFESGAGAGAAPVVKIGGNDQSANVGTGPDTWAGNDPTRGRSTAPDDYFTPAASGTVQKLFARTFAPDGTSAYVVQLALYEVDGDGVTLTNRVGAAATAPPHTGSAFGDPFTVELAVSLPITGGTTYAIAWQSDIQVWIADPVAGRANNSQQTNAGTYPGLLADPYDTASPAAFTGGYGLWCEYI